jgi:hypothetical protein
MNRVVQVVNAAAATAYLAANEDIDLCSYLIPYTYEDLSERIHTGGENQGYPPTRVYVQREEVEG